MPYLQDVQGDAEVDAGLEFLPEAYAQVTVPVGVVHMRASSMR
jgi:hypothetical protein